MLFILFTQQQIFLSLLYMVALSVLRTAEFRPGSLTHKCTRTHK